jgi:hypothetical protein
MLHAPHQKLQNQKPKYFLLISEKPLKKCAFKIYTNSRTSLASSGDFMAFRTIAPDFLLSPSVHARFAKGCLAEDGRR